jgi:hypothetical protein
MNLYNCFALAIMSCAFVAPCVRAQPAPTQTQPNGRPSVKQRADSEVLSNGGQHSDATGVQKQPTQGLPSSMVSDTGASWSSNKQPPDSK